MSNPQKANQQAPANDLQLPPFADSEGSRGVILRESLALFAQKGYGATTVRDIATRVGMLAGSLYSHFPSKEMILAELIHVGHSYHSQRLRAAVLASQPGPQQQLLALMHEHVLFHAEFTTLAIVANAEMRILSEELAKPALDLRNQNLQLLIDILNRGNELGVFDVADTTLTATVIGSMGARVANWYKPDYHLTPEEIAQQLTEMVRRIVGAASE